MGLMSAKDFLAKRNSPTISTDDGSNSPNNSPSPTISKQSKGLMSASDFLKNKQMNHVSPEMSLDDTMASQHALESSLNVSPQPFSNDPIVPSVHSLLNPDASQFMQNVNQINAANPQKDVPWLAKVQSSIYDHTLKPVEDFLGRASSSAIDTLSLGQSRKFQNNNPAPPFIPQEVQDWSKPAANTSEKAADIFGNLYGFSAMAPSLYATGGKAAIGGLAKIAPNAGKIAQMLTRGAGAGALYGTASEGLDAAISPNDKTIGQRLGNVGLDAAMFAGGDAALPFVGAGVKALGQKFAGTKIGDALNNFFSRNHPDATPDVSTQPDITPTIAKEPIRLKPLNSEDSFNSILPKVYQQATEQMTPPLENQNELAKWVQGHLNQDGHDVSLNDVRKLNYNDLSDMASELQKGFNTYNVVRQTAHDMGYGKIFDQSAPSLKDQIATDAQKRMYGIYPDNVNIGKSDSLNMSRSPIKPMDTGLSDRILNSSAKPNEPILLTPKQLAQQDRIDRFTQTESNPIIPDTANQIQSKTIADKTPFAQKANNAYIKGVDNVHRLNEFDKKVAEVTGDLPASEQSHTLALNSRGSDMISRQILEKNMVDSQGNVTGGSFKSVVNQIPKGKQSEFEDYLVAQHSITRMGRGEKVYKDELGMTVQKAQSKVAELEQANPDFKKAAESYYQYNQQLGKSWLVDTGLITPEQWQGYLDANPHYVPNQRIFSDLEKSQQFGSKGGFANQTAPIKKAEGSQRPIVRPIESTIENTAKYVKTAKQNEVMQTLYHNIQKDPESFKDWAEIVHDQPKSDVTELLHKDGPDGLLDEVAKSFDNATRKADLTKGNIVSAFVNGERVHIKVNDPQLLESLTNLGPQGQHFVMDTIGKVTKTMKVLTTGANPVFSLTRNIFRDIPTAFISSKSTNNIFKFGYDMVHSVLSVMGNGELYNSFKNIGGGHSSSIAADRNLLAQSMEKILPSKGIGQTLKRTLITKPYHALENLNNALETAPRLAEFKRFSKDGSYDSKVSGLYEANDVTTNFNRFGNYTKQADALFPYLNAAVQGLDKTVRVFKDNPTAAFSKAAGVVAVPTILMYALNHNNPDYQQLSNFVKDNNFLIPKGDGTFLKIPKSREFGALFSTPIERVLRQWNEHDPNAFQDFVHNFIQNIAPPGIGGAIQGAEQGGLTGALTGIGQDTIAGPIASLASNKDFANRPIVPQDLLKLSPKNQFDSKTSEPAKFLGNLFNTSPKQLDFLTKSYGGVLGQLGLPLTTQGGSIGETLKRQVTADPTFSNDISRNFYDAKNKADMAKADSKVTGEPLTKDLSSYYDRISNNLSSLRKLEKSVQKDNSLSKDEKNQKLKDLTQQMNSILKQSTLK